MSGTLPPIPPPFGTSSGNLDSPSVNRIDTMPSTTDPINTTTTTNVSQSVDENLLNFLIQEEGLMSQMFLLLTKRISRVGKLVHWSDQKFVADNRWKFLLSTFPVTLSQWTLSHWQQSLTLCLNLSRADRSCLEQTAEIFGAHKQNGLLVVSGSGPAVTSNCAVCCTLKPLVLPPISPEGAGNSNILSWRDKKGLIAESFDWDEEYVSLEDKGSIRIRAFMAIVEDEPSVRKADARFGQWVDITIKSKVTLDQLLSEQVPGNIVKALGGKGRRKENNASKEVVFTKADEYSSKPAPEITSDSVTDCDTQEPLPALPKLIGSKPSEPKVLVVQVSCSEKNASPSSEQLLLTLMEEIKGIKDHIKIPSVTSLSGSQASSSKPSKKREHTEQTTVKRTSNKLKNLTPLKPTPKKTSRMSNPSSECKYCGSNKHHPDNSGNKGLLTCNPLNPLKSGFTKGTNLCENVCAGLPKEESGPKVVFRDESSGETEGYGSANYNGITFTRVAYGTIFNQNDKVVLIAPRRRDVYVIDMSSFNKESNACFLAKASLSINWLRQKRLSHLNFKNINNLAKHNLVSGIPSLTFSKEKNCSACEKGKHHRASFKTKRSFFISKSLHFLHMDLFGPVKPQAISHNKYTLVIVDEYSRYTWVFCLKKKSDAADCIMSFIRKMETLNEVKVKQLGSDNGTEFRNHKLEELCDEKGEAVNTACYIQNRSIIVKRHVKTAYDVFKGRSLYISYFYMCGCPIHIHNHKDHLGKFYEKADDGFFLGYSPVAKAFRVFNIRRQEMEETFHVTFSEDDEAISQTSTEGDAINFNENRSFPDDEFIEPRVKDTQCSVNIEYFPYVSAYENITPAVSLNPHNSVSSKDSPEVTADDYPVLNLDHPESFDNLESAETQDNVTNEQISNFHHSPSDEDIHLSHVPQDR
ncbi:retrovirus-related pol polyprotein from transposon TNT 1-94 [Tanacetum coccineum]